MINGNITDFLEHLYLGEEIVFEYGNKPVFSNQSTNQAALDAFSKLIQREILIAWSQNNVVENPMHSNEQPNGNDAGENNNTKKYTP